MTDDLGPIQELIEILTSEGRGVTIMPVREGTPMGGAGTSDFYAFDGWEIGWVSAMAGGELAVGATIAEAVETAVRVLREEDRG